MDFFCQLGIVRNRIEVNVDHMLVTCWSLWDFHLELGSLTKANESNLGPLKSGPEVCLVALVWWAIFSFFGADFLFFVWSWLLGFWLFLSVVFGGIFGMSNLHTFQYTSLIPLYLYLCLNLYIYIYIIYVYIYIYLHLYIDTYIYIMCIYIYVYKYTYIYTQL